MFVSKINKNFLNEIKKKIFPLILIGASSELKNIVSGEIDSKLNTPFTILDFKKKVITVVAKNEFKKNSLINLNDYMIDKNERKIRKSNLELQLSEKEISFLILFRENIIKLILWNDSVRFVFSGITWA